MIFILPFNKIEMNNSVIQSTSVDTASLINFGIGNQINISNLNVQNFTSTSYSTSSLLSLTTLPFGSTTINGINMTDSNIGEYYVINFKTTVSGSLIANGLYFRNISLSSMLIATGTLNSFQIVNSTFESINKINAINEDSTIINIGAISLFQFGTYLMQNIVVESSTVTFFRMSQVNDANAVGKQLEISSLQFINTFSEYSVDMISISNLETSGDFQIVFTGVEASNLTFSSTGNLFNFRQQTATPLTLKDCYFHDLNGVNIYLESLNLANQELLTNVKMINITAENVSSGTKSFIINNEGGYLEIYNSSFTNMDNVERGAVVTGGYQNSQTLIYNSAFTNNTSIYGGVAYVHSGSVIKFYGCELTNNFAVQSGVIQVSDDGSFEFYNSTIRDNYAYSMPISEVFISSPISLISSSTISKNEALTSDFIIAQLDKCTDLCYFSDAYKEYLLSNVNLMDSKQIVYSIQCVSSNLIVSDNTIITGLPFIINAYLSSVIMKECQIRDIDSDSSILVMTATELVMEDLVVTKISTKEEGIFLSVMLDSHAEINYLSYNSSNMMLLRCFSSSIKLKLKIADIELHDFLLDISSSYDTVIENTSISEIRTVSDEAIHVSSSSFSLIENLTMSGLSSTAFYAQDSKFELIKSVKISGALKGMHFLRSRVSALEDTTVTN